MFEEGISHQGVEIAERPSSHAIEILPRPDDLEIRQLQEQALKNFEKRGLLHIVSDDEGNLDHVVIDDLSPVLERTVSINGKPVRGKDIVDSCAGIFDLNQSLTADREVPRLSMAEKLYWTFKGIPVMTREDVDQGVDERRNMFYVPSVTEMYDIDAMKRHEVDHYLRMWDVGGKWSSPHPTIENDFRPVTNENGEIEPFSRLDAAVPYEIYVSGNGARDEAGVLMVDKVPGHPENGRQKISGKWFTTYFFAGGAKNSATIESGRKFVQQKGAQLEKHGLLMEDDFQGHNSEVPVRKTQSRGQVNIGTRRFTLGAQYAGGEVIQVSGNNYAVEVNGEVRALFQASVDRENLRNCHTTYNQAEDRTFTLVPMGAFEIKKPGELSSFFVERYTDQGKKRDSIHVGDHIQELLDFKKGFSHKVQSGMVDMTLPEQTSAMLLVQDLEKRGDSRARALLSRTPDAAHLFADSFMNGDLDIRVLNIVNIPENEQRDLLARYVEFRKSSDEFVTSISDQLEEKNMLSPTDQLLLERVKQSFAFRAQHLLILDAQYGYAEAKDPLKLYSEALSHAEAALSGKAVIEKHEDPGVMTNAGYASVSTRYQMEDSSRVTITVRPQEVLEEYEKGQSRLGITATTAENQKVSIRLDCDEYGISLDIGTRGSPLVTRLQELQLSHHTQETFEGGLSNKVVFERFARKLPKAFGWSTQL